MIKKDCFAFRERNGHMGCKALKELYCKDCKFYRDDINEAEIEQDIRHYSNTQIKSKEVVYDKRRTNRIL